MKRLVWLMALYCAISTPALAEADQSRIQAQFSDALKSLDAGDAGGAAEKLGRLYTVTRAPRVRLEWARALAASGQLAKAREVLVEAYEDDPPPAVKVNIVTLIDRIDKLFGKFTFGLSLTRVRNPLNQPSDFQFNLGGYKLNSNQNTNKMNVFGVIYSLGYEKSFTNGLDVRSMNSFRDLPNSWGDYFSSDTSIGYTTGLSGIYGRLGLQFFQETDNSFRLPYVEVGLKLDVSDRVSITPKVQLGYFDSLEGIGLSGPNYRISIPINYAVDPAKSFTVAPAIERRTTEFTEQSYTTFGITLASSLNYESFSLGLSVVPTYTTFDKIDPFWGARRVDRSVYLSAEISSDRIRYKGFVPSIGLYYEMNRSTIPFYTRNDYGISSSLKKLF